MKTKIQYNEIDYDDVLDLPVPEGMKRVEVQVYWKWYDTKTFDIPKDVELGELASQIKYEDDPYFDFDMVRGFKGDAIYEVSVITDNHGNEWS